MNRRQICLATAAGVLFGAMAKAGEGGPHVGNPISKAIYEGVDAKGRLVCLTISGLDVETFSRVRVENRAAQAVPHWSSLIGTGTAAQAERKP
jgi:hypothetical protein